MLKLSIPLHFFLWGHLLMNTDPGHANLCMVPCFLKCFSIEDCLINCCQKFYSHKSLCVGSNTCYPVQSELCVLVGKLFQCSL